VLCVTHEVAWGQASGAVVDLRGTWETPMGCATRSKAPQRLCLPNLQALQVAEEVRVVPPPSPCVGMLVARLAI
jgi:hypothetical protein